MATIIKDLGAVSAYAYAVEKGYTGTEAEFAELMADYADVGQRAEDAAESALNSKTAAQTAAQTATSKASEASTSATSASGSATAASASASAASGSATSAANSATAASGSATAAAGSATTASTKASEASASATAANTAKIAAEAAQSAAETAQGKAEDAQEAAETTAQSISASAAQIATNTADITQLQSEVSELPIDGVAGNSKQLLSENGTDNTEPYMFRAVPVNADRAELDAVVGGTVVWNQLAPDTVNGWIISHASLSLVDGSFKLVAGSYAGLKYCDAEITSNHKILAYGEITPPESSNALYGVYEAGNNYVERYIISGGSGKTAVSKVFNSYENAKCFRITHATSTSQGAEIIFKINVIDLTAMFGSTIADYIYSLEQSTAGAGVAFFRKLFPKDYYPYDAGTLKSVEGVSSHDMVGFNQFDKSTVTTNAAINSSGSVVTGTNTVSDWIRVFPDTAYYVKDVCPATVARGVNTYDINKTRLGSPMPNGSSSATKGIINTASNVAYIRIEMLNTNVDTACVNISDPTKNGTYKPYVKHSYPLDNTLTLRGIPKLADGKLYYDGDRYLPDGTVERKYAVVDLGTLAWSTRATGTVNALYSSALPSEYVGQNTVSLMKDKMIGDKKDYQGPTTAATLIPIIDEVDVGIYSYINGGANTKTIYAVIPVGENITNTWHLVYELATPTTETADSYQSLQVCDPNGTEEFVTTGIVPVGHETRYPENLRAKIEGLPWDFSSLIAPTEKTTTASRNYTTGALLIMNNVLYKVTANIANGGTITPGTNVTATTLSEVISALQ